MEKIFLIINEQHSLMENQKEALREKFGEVEIEEIKVPSKGWTKEEMDNIVRELRLKLVKAKAKFPNHPEMSDFYEFTYGRKPTAVVFVSPIPYMIKRLSQLAMCPEMGDEGGVFEEYGVFVFHNDKREKKKLDNGKVIYTVAKDGWEII